MVLHMKTTVEIVDSLFDEAKRLAAEENTTVRALVEEGLRRVVEDRRANEPFTLRRVTFRGRGMRPNAGDGSWDAIREMVYEGRGA